MSSVTNSRDVKDVTNLRDIKEIDLSALNLKEIDDDFFDAYPMVETIYLQHNGLRKLPTSIKNLKHLITIDLHGNALEEIPLWLNDLPNLKYITLGNFDLYVNRGIMTFPPHIIIECTDHPFE